MVDVISVLKTNKETKFRSNFAISKMREKIISLSKNNIYKDSDFSRKVSISPFKISLILDDSWFVLKSFISLYGC